MISVFSNSHRLHFGKYELIDGQFVTPFECPERLDIIMQRIAQAKLGKVVEPLEFGLDPIARVHTHEFIEFLRTAHASWKQSHGDTDAMPICWPTRTFRQKPPMEIEGKLSYYSFDAGTPITAGTWPAITASINVALTGVELIQSGQKKGIFSLQAPGSQPTIRYLRGILLLQQCRCRRSSPAGQGSRTGGLIGCGLSPWQRQPVYFLRPGRCPLRVTPRRSQAGVSIFSWLCG